MQTFLPYPALARSLACLDNRRLGKQRLEALQILRVLAGQSTGWANHPAVRMWTGHAALLTHYYNVSLRVWAFRGFQNVKLTPLPAPVEFAYPWWWGRPAFHRSHQSNLLRKLPEHYGPLFPGVPDDLPYWWPTEHEAEKCAILRTNLADLA